MAAVRWKPKAFLALAIFVLFVAAADACDIPADYHGDWYYMDHDGSDINTIIDKELFGGLGCLEIKKHENSYSNIEGINATMLMKRKWDAVRGRFLCVDVLYRTKNILQVRRGSYFTSNNGIENMCPGYTLLPTVDTVETYFRHQNVQTVNCNTTFEGIYQFTYEMSWGGGGICDSADSQIEACQDPGSAYVDNEVFNLTYARCPDIQWSFSQNNHYQCMGSWFAMVGNTGYTFAAIANTEEQDRREKYKCLITLKNQKSADNSIRWGMSRFARCNKLYSIYDGPVKLVMRRNENCPATTTTTSWLNSCGEGRQFCDGVKKCVSLSQLCDGKDDCGNNSDEQNCKDAPAAGNRVNCTTGESCRNFMACKTGGVVYCCPGMSKLEADGNTGQCTCSNNVDETGILCSGGGSFGPGSQFLPSIQGSNDKCKKDRDCDNEYKAMCRRGDVKVCCPGGFVRASFTYSDNLWSCSCSVGSGYHCSTTSVASHTLAPGAAAILFLAIPLAINLS